MPLPPLRVFNGLQRGGGRTKWTEAPHSHSTVPRRPARFHPARRPKMPSFPAPLSLVKDKGRQHPVRIPRPATAPGHGHTHTQAREAWLSVAHLRAHSPPAPRETRRLRSPGPVSGTGHARNFVRMVATLPEAHARTLHAGSQE